MRNEKFSLRKSQDPVAYKYRWMPITQSKHFGFSFSRDGCRTPIQWTGGPNAGFSSNPAATPWLRISKSSTNINVEKQEKDPNSLLNFYRRILKVRRENIALQEGLLQLEPPTKQSLIYYRLHLKQKLAILLNFSNQGLTIPSPLDKPTLLFSTHLESQALDPKASTANIQLQPYEGLILE